MDKTEVIEAFRSKAQREQDLGGEYNIMGKVPLVDPGLAQKYLNLRRNLKEEEEQEQSELVKELNSLKERSRAANRHKKRR